jgi:hypothetical protein
VTLISTILLETSVIVAVCYGFVVTSHRKRWTRQGEIDQSRKIARIFMPTQDCVCFVFPTEVEEEFVAV